MPFFGKISYRITLCSIFVLCLLTNHAWAKKSDERNAAIDSLLEVGYQHVLNIQIDSAVYYATDALRLSEAARYSAGITRSCYQLGEMLMASANYSKALTYFARASKEKYGIQSALYQAQIQKQIGQIYTYLKLHVLAI